MFSTNKKGDVSIVLNIYHNHRLCAWYFKKCHAFTIVQLKKENGNTVIVLLVHMLDLEVQLLLSCVCRVDEDDNSRMLLAGLTG